MSVGIVVVALTIERAELRTVGIVIHHRTFATSPHPSRLDATSGLTLLLENGENHHTHCDDKERGDEDGELLGPAPLQTQSSPPAPQSPVVPWLT